MHDSVQLYGNLFIPIINIIIFLIIALIIFSLRSKSYSAFVILSFVLLFGIGLINNYEFDINKKRILISNFSEINLILKISKPKLAYIREANEYNNPFVKLENVYLGGLNNLMRAMDPTKAVCISSTNIPVYNDIELKFKESLSFNKYFETLKKTEPNITLGKAQLVFCREFDIDYLLVSRNRDLPTYFNSFFNNISLGSIDDYSIFKRHESIEGINFK